MEKRDKRGVRTIMPRQKKPKLTEAEKKAKAKYNADKKQKWLPMGLIKHLESGQFGESSMKSALKIAEILDQLEDKE